jgi:hypothetical protein
MLSGEQEWEIEKEEIQESASEPTKGEEVLRLLLLLLLEGGEEISEVGHFCWDEIKDDIGKQEEFVDNSAHDDGLLIGSEIGIGERRNLSSFKESDENWDANDLHEGEFVGEVWNSKFLLWFWSLLGESRIEISPGEFNFFRFSVCIFLAEKDIQSFFGNLILSIHNGPPKFF